MFKSFKHKNSKKKGAENKQYEPHMNHSVLLQNLQTDKNSGLHNDDTVAKPRDVKMPNNRACLYPLLDYWGQW